MSVWRTRGGGGDPSPLHLLSANSDQARKYSQLTPCGDEWKVQEHLENDVSDMCISKKVRDPESDTSFGGGKGRL